MSTVQTFLAVGAGVILALTLAAGVALFTAGVFLVACDCGDDAIADRDYDEEVA